MCHVNAATEADRCNHLNSQPPRRYCCETQNITVIQPPTRICQCTYYIIYRTTRPGNGIKFLLHSRYRYTVQVLKFLSPNAKMQNGPLTPRSPSSGLKLRGISKWGTQYNGTRALIIMVYIFDVRFIINRQTRYSLSVRT